MSREDEIREIAYQLWEQENRANGRAAEHWARAEQIWEQKQRQKVSVVPERPVVRPPAVKTPTTKPPSNRGRAR